MTVVPATMYIYKDAAWWLPPWIQRALPDLDIEGNKLAETASQATPTESAAPPHLPA